MKRIAAYLNRTLRPDSDSPATVFLIVGFHVLCLVLAVVLLTVLRYFRIPVDHPLIQVGFGAFLCWLLWLKKKRSKKNVAS
ncbi:hypothetical protein [Burkholderia sp. BCC1993]|uniref:hypothetical protein n=1 Tax=Burkholderia sp. BCC1993 TaxID=2817444 RepID=UPI002AB2C546|nr:hypothetical protein [Burkholderia sp. BCC1993]